MFDIGFSELFVIAVVALLVLGPERLPKAARFAGLWMRRARAQWYAVKSELEHELAAEELRRSLRETQDELRDAHTRLQREGAALREEARAATRVDEYGDVRRDDTATDDAVSDDVRSANAHPDAIRHDDAPAAAGASTAAVESAHADAPAVRDER